jgi:hypothetical protein
MIVASLGNTDLLKARKIAFLCSREIPASVVLKCYDWAIAGRDVRAFIISGFHSQIEKDVLHFLLKETQPIIVALARGLKERLEPEFKKPLQENRMLIITPFDKEVKRVTKETSETRNKLMIELAEEIVVGYARPQGNIDKLLKGSSGNKKVSFL